MATPDAHPTTSAQRWVTAAVLVGALQPLLRVPLVPWLADDWILYGSWSGLIGREQGYAASRYDLFAFTNGDPAATARIIDSGFIPWFTSPEIRVAFWRPLASLTHHLDFSLFGTSSVAPLIHSLAWYLALCAIVATLLQRWLPGRAGGLAGLLFALAATHQQAVSWIASRNAVMTALFGMLALWAHLRWREDGWRPGLPASLVALGLGLASGEAVLGALAFVVAWELAAARDALAVRARALLPALSLTALWLVAWVAQGYGTSGSSAYIDPFHQPLDFAAAAPLRIAYSMGVLFLGVPADLWVLVGSANNALGVVGLASAAGVAVWVRAVWTDWSPERRRAVRWLSLALLLSLVPQLGGQLGGRSYVIASTASSAILGCLAADSWTRSAWARSLALGGVGLLHVAWALVVYVGLTVVYTRLDQQLFDTLDTLDLLEQPDSDRRPIVLTVPNILVGAYLPHTYAGVHGELLPGWRSVSVAECDHELTRAGSHAFRLRLVDGALFQSSFEELMRAEGQPSDLGTITRLEGMEVELVGLNDQGLVDEIEVRLDTALDEAELWAWHRGQMVRVAPPRAGEPLRLEWTPPF